VVRYLTSHPRVPGLALAAQVHGDTTAFWWAAGIFGVGFLLALLILPARCEAPATTVRAALARHVIGNCGYAEVGDGALVTEGPGSPEPALVPQN
jgi:hypothetical protein